MTDESAELIITPGSLTIRQLEGRILELVNVMETYRAESGCLQARLLACVRLHRQLGERQIAIIIDTNGPTCRKMPSFWRRCMFLCYLTRMMPVRAKLVSSFKAAFVVGHPVPDGPPRKLLASPPHPRTSASRYFVTALASAGERPVVFREVALSSR